MSIGNEEEKESQQLSAVSIEKDNKVLDVEHASDIYGDFGPLQRNATIFYIMIYIVAAFQNNGIVFYTPPIDYKCKLPFEFENSTNVGKCSFDFDNVTYPCTEWIYDNSFYKSTLIDEFNLVCGRDYFISLSKTIYQIGYLIASIFTGWLSDKHGRLYAFKFSILLELAANLSQTLSVNIYQFLISRLFLGIGAFGRFSTGSLLLFELVGPSYRATVGIGSELGWCFSALILPIANYFVPHYRYMMMIVFSYEFIFLWWLWKLPESPRWLITHDKFKEASRLITKTAKATGKFSDEEIENKLQKFKRFLLCEENKIKQEAKKTILDLWRVSTLRRFCIALYILSFASSFVAYSFSYNAALYGGSLHMTKFIQGLSTTGVFVLIYLIVNRFPRKVLAVNFGLIGMAFLLAMIPFTFKDEHLNVLTGLMFFGSFFGDGFFFVLMLMKAEIFPTTLRQIGTGSCSVAMRFGSTIAPYSRELAHLTHLSVLIGLFSVLALTKSICVLFLPETCNGDIPDTIDEAREAFKRKGKRGQPSTNHE